MPDITSDFDPEEFDDTWSVVRPERQRGGRIKGRGNRKTGQPITAGDQNRAGHRLYVKVNQNRQFRKNILGLGRWRRHNESDEMSHAMLASPPVKQAPRAERRPAMRAAYRTARKLRLRAGR